ncbi:hypothetical protein [Actinosynnema sp. NPDC023587]|uniref:hypothetical protein n=1 Tax=Actinosynnema sp. NPDC023587 TaxID=3154695 RepID=UPI0034079569
MTVPQTLFTTYANNVLQRTIPEFFRNLDADDSEKLKQSFDSDATLLVDGKPIHGAVAIAEYLVKYRTEHALVGVEAQPLGVEKFDAQKHDLIVLAMGYVRPAGSRGEGEPFAFTFRFDSGTDALIASGVYRIMRRPGLDLGQGMTPIDKM